MRLLLSWLSMPVNARRCVVNAQHAHPSLWLSLPVDVLIVNVAVDAHPYKGRSCMPT